MRSTMSLLGLYQWDSSVLDGLDLPAELDKETMRDNLLMECAELEILYTDPDFLKLAIGAWAKKEKPIWEHLCETLHYDYNPIENYDRNESWTDENSHENTTTNNGSMTNNGSSDSTGTSSTTDEVSAYNQADAMTPRQKSTTNNTGKNTNTDTSTTEGTVNENGSANATRTGRTHGNIGVTTTQEMIEEERRVAEFRIYDYIIKSFKQRFCLLVY